MPDSTGAPQDDAAQTDSYQARFDGLMSAHQKALAELRDLKAAGQTDGQSDSIADLEDGAVYLAVNGRLERTDPPVPRGNSGVRDHRRSKSTDQMSAAELRDHLDKIEGRETRPSGGWFGR